MRLRQYPYLFIGVSLVCLTFSSNTLAAPASEGPQGRATAPSALDHGELTLRLDPGSAQWWLGFSDDQLDALVQTGLSQNLDVRAAQLRIVESEALIVSRRAPLMPTVSWDSSINLAPTDSLGFQFGGSSGGTTGDPNAAPPPNVYWSGSSVLNVAWDLDITGRRVLDLKASRDDLEAARVDVGASEVTVAASIVSAYYDLVAARARARVVEEQIETVSELMALTEARYETGRADATDLLQQRQQLAATLTLRPQAQAQARAFSQQLAVLLGESPQTQHATPDRLPDVAPTDPGLDRYAMISRRPDVRAAQTRVKAAERREKVARREFAPTLGVSANAGVQAIAITQVNEQWYWGAGAQLSVPIFAGGRSLGVLRQRKAQAASSRNEVERLELEASRQVEAAKAAQGEQLLIVAASTDELRFARDSYGALRERYFEGDVDVLNLLSALSSQQQAQLNLITAQRDLVATHIDLQRALAPAPRTGGSIPR